MKQTDMITNGDFANTHLKYVHTYHLSLKDYQKIQIFTSTSLTEQGLTLTVSDKHPYISQHQPKNIHKPTKKQLTWG